MVVGVCKFLVSMPGTRTLKEKRARLRPLLHGLANQHRVSVAEVDLMDVPDQAVIGFALVSNDRRLVNSVIDKIMAQVETLAEVLVMEHDFEIVNY
jgi:uncharacterized protein YlxP (DUF503 family)